MKPKEIVLSGIDKMKVKRRLVNERAKGTNISWNISN